MTKLIIDADTLVYMATVARRSYNVERPPGNILYTFNTKKEAAQVVEAMGPRAAVIVPIDEQKPWDLSKRIVQQAIESIENVLGSRDSLLLFTSGANFRYQTATVRAYKAGRPEKPVNYTALRKWVEQNYAHCNSNDFNCEADDLVAIVAEMHAAENMEYVVCGIDKDLLCVPGWHYNYNKLTFQKVTKREGQHQFWLQLLMGDSTDCITGLPRVGIKTAAKILAKGASNPDWAAIVLDAYEKAFMKKPSNFKPHTDAVSYMTEMAQLVHLQRYIGEVWKYENYRN